MTTQQPIWKLVANLGDRNVADYGGFLVYVDTTGVYRPEVELYEPNTDEDYTGGTMYRFVLEPPRFKTNGSYREAIGEYDKVWHREWFSSPERLKSAADTCCMSAFSLLRDLASKDPVRCAVGYQTLISTYGPGEFDHYPVTLTEDEAQQRYAEVMI